MQSFRERLEILVVGESVDAAAIACAWGFMARLSIQRKRIYLEESIDLVLDALLASGVEHFLEAVVPGQDKKIR